MIKQTNKTTWLLIVLIITTFAFAMWGWIVDMNKGFNDALYRTVSVFFMSDIYQDLGEFQKCVNLNIARWTGFFSIVLAASKAIMLLLSEQMLLWRTRSNKNHLMIIGCDAFANALAFSGLKNNKKVTWLAASVSQKTQQTKNLFISDDKWNLKEAELFGLKNAHSVTIATGDDASAIAIARQIRNSHPDEKKLVIHVNIKSPWLAMRFDQVKDVKGLHLISNAQAAIRQTHRKHPPFLMAQKMGHKRIHSVIVGFGLHGESVLIDTVLSCLTSYLKKPCFTIIDPKAKSIQNNLKIKYPDLHLSAKINFIQKSVGGRDRSITQQDWIAIAQKTPVTNTYVCMPKESTSLSVGLALQTLAQRNDWQTGPIFIRLSSKEVLPTTKAGVKHLETARFISWGDLNSLIKETGILNDDGDGLAKTMHQAYRAIAPEDKEANVPWEQLNEDNRDSNRRVIFHIAAKLSSTGMDIEPWLKEWDKNPQITHLPKIDTSIVNKKLHNKLAVLEHDRWMADKRINGWQYGKRDNIKRLHPDLIPFAELSKKSQSFDLQIIDTLIKMLSKG